MKLFLSSKIASLLIVSTLLITPSLSYGQELHLVMMQDALQAVRDLYINAINKKGRTSAVADGETDSEILGAKKAILEHAFPSSRDANGNEKVINDNITNQIKNLDHSLVSTKEVFDAAFTAIRGREVLMDAGGYLLDATGATKPLEWGPKLHSHVDGQNALLKTLADQLDSFRAEFDRRSGSDSFFASVRGSPNVSGVTFRESTLSLHHRIAKMCADNFSHLTRWAQGNSVSLLTSYSDNGQKKLFWNENSPANTLPGALDAVATHFDSRAATVAQQRQRAAPNSIPTNRRWQAFEEIQEQQLNAIFRTNPTNNTDYDTLDFVEHASEKQFDRVRVDRLEDLDQDEVK